MKYLILVYILIAPIVSLAWGGDGHQITALIAEDRLTPAAKAGIRDLLGADVNISDAEVSDWADVVKRTHPQQGPWHYVDIPADVARFDEKRDGRDGNNVIDKIGEFEKTLADTSKPKQDRGQALRFLVHLVGDIHQPLHCAERDQDKGGNTVKIQFLDRKSSRLNLHQAWDSLILLDHKGRTRNADYADGLNAKITSKQAAEWSKGTPEDWANESHAIAVKVIYKDVPPSTQPTKIDRAELDKYAPIIDEQLQQGGVRLAAILNRTFK